MLLFQLLRIHKTPPVCLSSHTSFCSYSHSSCFSHTRLLGAPHTHPAPIYIRAFAVFLSLCSAFQSYLLLADFFWSLSSQLNVTNPAKTPTSPHHHHLSSCPLALSSEPYVLFPHLLGFRLCALQNFAVCSILLFCSFLIFFPKVILCIYFLSCWNSVSSMYISQQKPFVSLDKSNSSLVNP